MGDQALAARSVLIAPATPFFLSLLQSGGLSCNFVKFKAYSDKGGRAPCLASWPSFFSPKIALKTKII
jgi:hypothetical protein